jgi:hypothetical protein
LGRQDFPVLDFFSRAKVALGGTEHQLPKRKLQPGESKDGGLMYTDRRLGAQMEILVKEKNPMYQRISFVLSALMLTVLCGNVCVGQEVKNKIDVSKTAVILPFGSSVKGAVGLPDATRTAVILFLKEEGLFSAVLTPEEAQEKDKSALVEIGGTLVDFAPGNMATRVVIGLGSGRAHAGFDFTVKDSATGTALWQKHIKETASFWSNSA